MNECSDTRERESESIEIKVSYNNHGMIVDSHPLSSLSEKLVYNI